jgi:Cdc6-like AAA superfamily ATPase
MDEDPAKALTEGQFRRMTAHVGRVFTPSAPISKMDLFSGRDLELKRIGDAVTSPGRHAILFGERGIGKTSLASVLKDWFKEDDSVRIAKANCEKNDTFPSVWDKMLAEVTILEERGNGTELDALNQYLNLQEYVGPGQVRKVLQIGCETIPELVLVFDEFDRLGREHRAAFAETIKDLSDNLPTATIVLVGVAENVGELITDHASIARNVSEIRMRAMMKEEIQKIITTGLSVLKMTIEDESMVTIITLSQGYPHFAHLLAKAAALSALESRRLRINQDDVMRAVEEAVKDNSYNVAEDYHKATTTQRKRKETLFEKVLIAAALAHVDDDQLGWFASTDVKPMLNAITGDQYEIYGFSQHLNKFANDGHRGPPLEKRGALRAFRYRFRNPLLKSYAIIKGMADGLISKEMLHRLANPPPKKARSDPKVKIMPRPKPPEPSLFDEQKRAGEDE